MYYGNDLFIAFNPGKSYASGMNKFKKPYGARTSNGRPGTGARPTSRFASYGPARARTTSPRDARTYRSARSGSEGGAFQKFDAVCSNCGKKCQVPFRPDGTKPVYCKDCFGAPRDAMAGKKKFSVAPAAARFNTPAASFSAAPAGGKSIADLTRQIAAMNTKIDTMLKILTEGAAEEE
jgi:CxxC-x17-CxxC domain-containing protein